MKNFIQKAIKFILINITTYLIIGCNNNDNTQTVPTQKATDNDIIKTKEKKELIKLQSYILDKLKQNKIKLETLEINKIPKTKKGLNAIDKKINSLNQKASQIKEFVNEREGNFTIGKEYYNNEKIDLNKTKKIEDIINKRKSLERQAEQILKKDKSKKERKNIDTKKYSNNKLNEIIFKDKYAIEISRDNKKTKLKNKLFKQKKIKIQEFLNIKDDEINDVKLDDGNENIEKINYIKKIFSKKNPIYDPQGNIYDQSKKKQYYYKTYNSQELKEQLIKYNLIKSIKKRDNTYFFKNLTTEKHIFDEEKLVKQLYKHPKNILTSLKERAALIKQLQKDNDINDLKAKYITEDLNQPSEDVKKEIEKSIEDIKIELKNKEKDLNNEFNSLKNEYFINITTKEIKQYEETDITQLKENLKQEDKGKKIEIINLIKKINKQMKQLTTFKQFKKSPTSGIYVKESNNNIKLITNIEELVKTFDLFKNIKNLPITKIKLEDIEFKLNKISANIDINKKLFTKKALKPDNKTYFNQETIVPVPGEIDEYSTVKELTKNEETKASKLLKRQTLINLLTNKNYKYKLEDITNGFKQDNITQDILFLNSLKIASINKNKDQQPVILNAITNENNLNWENLKKELEIEIKMNDDNENKYSKELKRRIKSTISKYSGSITYYNKVTKETIFNTKAIKSLILSANLNQNSDLKTLFETLINEIKNIYELKNNQIIKANFSELQANNSKDFIKKYLNQRNQENKNIANYIEEAMTVLKNNNSEKLQAIQYLANYLKTQGLTF